MRVLLAIALFFASTSASAITYNCNNCNSMQEVNIKQAAPIGNHYILDNTRETVKKFRVYRVCNGTRCHNNFSSAGVEPEVVDYVTHIHAVKDQPVHLPTGTYDFPDNAYDAIRFPQQSAEVGRFIKDGGIQYVQDFLTFLGAVNPISGFDPSKISLTLTIIYSDGSTSIYKYSHSSGKWDRQKGRSVDSSGNTIPETAADASGGAGPGSGGPGTEARYNFSSDLDMVNFLNQLSMMGVPITNGGASSGTSCSAIKDTIKCVTVSY